jgi:hypothetical protein
MGIENPKWTNSLVPGDRDKLVAVEEAQGYSQYSETFDSIERDPVKAQAAIAQALLDKAVSERAFSQAMGAAGQKTEEEFPGGEVMAMADDVIEKAKRM